MTYLAVSIAAANTEAALAQLRRARAAADLAELRLDLMGEFDLIRLLAERPLPVIVTCRPTREGGRWIGNEKERLAILCQAAAAGAEYVDLEWDAAEAATSVDRSQTRLILSRHDLAGMPADLAALAEEMGKTGADVVKVVGTAQSLADAVSVVRLLEQTESPTIAIAMGPYGLISRLLAFRHAQAFLSFATPDNGSQTATAPGQVDLATMREIYRVHVMTLHTKLIGLVAPDANDSPDIVSGNRWLAQQGVDAVLIPLQASEADRPEHVAQDLGMAGYIIPCSASGQPAQVIRLEDGGKKAAPVRGVEQGVAWLVEQGVC